MIIARAGAGERRKTKVMLIDAAALGALRCLVAADGVPRAHCVFDGSTQAFLLLLPVRVTKIGLRHRIRCWCVIHSATRRRASSTIQRRRRRRRQSLRSKTFVQLFDQPRPAMRAAAPSSCQARSRPQLYTRPMGGLLVRYVCAPARAEERGSERARARLMRALATFRCAARSIAGMTTARNACLISPPPRHNLHNQGLSPAALTGVSPATSRPPPPAAAVPPPPPPPPPRRRSSRSAA